MKQVWLYGYTARVVHLAEAFEDFRISAFAVAGNAVGAGVAGFSNVFDVDIGDVIFQVFKNADSHFAVCAKVAGVKVESEIRRINSLKCF